MRKCSVCEEFKPLEAFNKNKTMPLGRAYFCRACRSAKRDREKDKAYAKQHRINDIDRAKGIAARYREKHKSEIEEQRRIFYAEHRDEALARVKQYYQDNTESRRAYSRAYHYRVRSVRLRYNQRWHVAHQQEENERAREYRRLHPEKTKQYRHARRARKRAAGGVFTSYEWEALKAHYQYTCLACGQFEPHIKLTPDHVVPLSRGGRNDIQNIQPLCLLCNLRKSTKSTDYRRSIGAIL